MLSIVNVKFFCVKQVENNKYMYRVSAVGTDALVL